MTIQVKSYFGEWKTVSREQAQAFITCMLDGGCVRSKINENHLRGIMVDELLPRNPKPKVFISKMENTVSIPTQKQKSNNKNMVEMKNCVVEMETLAREEAFFGLNKMFHFRLWFGKMTKRCAISYHQ